MEIKIKVNKEDLVHQGLNVQLVSYTSCEHNNKSFADIPQKIKEQISKADAHWQRQLDVMEHAMGVLRRRMDAFKKRNPDF